MFKIIALLLIICTLSLAHPAPVCNHLNETCGGVQQYKCCTGEQLQCVYETPIHPEANGVCQRVCHREGHICGGYNIDPQVCCEGYTCVDKDPRIPDLPGKCHKMSRNG